jgi:GDP-L-fucose synthase
MWTLENYNEKESLILSVGEKNEVAIKDVALEIAKSYDYELMMEFDTRYSDGQFKKTADNAKLMNLIGDFDFTPISSGIQKNTKWFIDNFDVARK